MAVFRIEKTRDYTVMSNYHLRDMSLSLKAKGLLSLMVMIPLFGIVLKAQWILRKKHIRL